MQSYQINDRNKIKRNHAPFDPITKRRQEKGENGTRMDKSNRKQTDLVGLKSGNIDY